MLKNESPNTPIYTKKITQYMEAPDQLAPPLTLYTCALIGLTTPYVVANSIETPYLKLRVGADWSSTYALTFFWNWVSLGNNLKSGLCWEFFWKYGVFE